MSWRTCWGHTPRSSSLSRRASVTTEYGWVCRLTRNTLSTRINGAGYVVSGKLQPRRAHTTYAPMAKKSENGFRTAIKRVAIGGVLTALISLLIASVFRAVGSVVGFGTGPDDMMNLTVYGFVVGCVCWGIRAKPTSAAIVTGLTSALLVTTILIVLSLMSAHTHPRLPSIVAIAAFVYGIIGAVSGYSSGYCYLYTKKNYEMILL
jgi:hypothetical protein